MKKRFMYIRPFSHKCKTLANRMGVTVCYTMPQDNGSPHIQYVLTATKKPKYFSPALVHRLLDVICKTDPSDPPKYQKKELLKQIAANNTFDQFCKKTGRTLSAEKYDNTLKSNVTLDDIKSYAQNLMSDDISSAYKHLFNTYPIDVVSITDFTIKTESGTNIHEYLNKVLTAESIADVSIEFVNACIYREASKTALLTMPLFELHNDPVFFIRPTTLNI